MKILGHRGASADFAENTLEAMVGAASQGADGVELDVQRCASGELVVCHDPHLQRLAGVPWRVPLTPWWKLRKADVGSRLGFPAARIPLLEDVIAALPPDFVINVELKCDEVDDAGLSVAVGQVLVAQRDPSRFFVSSFNPLCLVRLARAFPALQRGQLIDPEAPSGLLWAPLTSRTSVHPHHSACTAESVARWHSAGWAVATWTVDDAAEAARLEQLGVDWLITNRPGAMRAELRASR